MKTLYYDAFRCGLVCVEYLKPSTIPNKHIVRVKRSNKYYKVGETFEVFGHCLVNKTRFRSGHQMVCNANLTKYQK